MVFIILPLLMSLPTNSMSLTFLFCSLLIEFSPGQGLYFPGSLLIIFDGVLFHIFTLLCTGFLDSQDSILSLNSFFPGTQLSS